MKIILVGPLPLPVNGCSLANEVLVNGLNISNVENFVIDTNTANISSGQVGKFSFKKVFSFLGAYKYLFNIRKAHVVYTTPGQTFFGLLKYAPFYYMSRICGKPYIIHIHGNHVGNEYRQLTGVKKKIFGNILKKAAAGIVLSESLRKNFEGLLPPEKVFVVENFVQDTLFENAPETKDRQLLKPLYLSNLMNEKGIHYFLDALIMLKEAGIPFEAHIAGKLEDEAGEEINKKLDALKGFAQYHGVVYGEAKNSLLINCNTFVLPTFYRMEGQPIALLEAMAAGNIIVTTHFSGIPDIVTTNNGYFVETQDTASIFNVLKNISQNLGDNIDKFFEHNKTYARENFTEAGYTKKIVQVFNSVAKQS